MGACESNNMLRDTAQHSVSGELDRFYARDSQFPDWHMVDTWSCEVETANLLRALVLQHKPRTIVETGTNTGFTSLHLAIGCDDNGFGEVHTMDNHAWPAVHNHIRIYRVIADSGLPHPAIPKEIDLLFLDSAHTLEHVKREMGWLYPRVNQNGLVILHDWYQQPLRDSYRWICETYDVKPMVLPNGRGLFMWTKNVVEA